MKETYFGNVIHFFFLNKIGFFSVYLFVFYYYSAHNNKKTIQTFKVIIKKLDETNLKIAQLK